MKNINIHNLIIEKSTNNIGAFSSYIKKNKEMISAFKRLFPRANKQLDILYALKVD